LNSILKMFADIKHHKAMLTVLIACGAISSAFKASASMFIQFLVSLIFPSEPNALQQATEKYKSFNPIELAQNLNIDPLLFTTALLISTFFLTNIFRYIFMFNIRSLAEGKAVKTREVLMEHYLSLDARFKNSLSDGSGGLISRILNDVVIYQEGIKRLADLLKEPFLIFFSIAYLFFINWKIALFLLVGLPPILIIIRNLAMSLRKHSSKSQETMESVTMTLKEGLDGARVIHSFNLEKIILGKFKMHTKSYLKTIKKIITREELSGPLTESLSSIIFCGSFLLIAYLVQHENLTFGEFTGIATAIALLTEASKKTQTAFIRIQQASVAKERIDSIIGTDTNTKKLSGLKSFPNKLSRISFEGVTVKVGKKEILKSFSFATSSQKTIALVGPSGSGKSTLLNCIDTYILPSCGDIKFNEQSILDTDPVDLRKHISLVSQDPFLFNTSVFENLKYAKQDLTEEEAHEALKLSNADFILSLPNGIHTQVGEGGSRFSGGEKQRLSIARALVKNSPILLLDEATSALDTQSEKEVQKGLDSLKEGRTCFVVAHRLSTIMEADTILVMSEGQIIEQGSHEDLIIYRSIKLSKKFTISLL